MGKSLNARKLAQALLGTSALLALIAGAGPAAATDVIVNGGFETGTLAGWTVAPDPTSGSCDTNWNVSNSHFATGCESFGHDVPNPVFGSFAAYQSFDGDGPLTRVLSQSFVVGNGGLTVANLGWSQTYGWDMDTFSNGALPRTFKVELYDAANVLIGTVSTTTINGDTVGTVGWTAFAANVQALLASQAGNLVTLRFTSTIPQNFTGPAGLGLDNVFLDLQYLCNVGAGNDTCFVQSSTATNIIIDADGHATGDTLQVGGTTSFSFDAAKIGNAASFRNFEFFQKVGTSNVTLTGIAGAAADWQVLAGTLTASGGNAIFNTSSVTVSGGASFVATSPETLGALTINAGGFAGGNLTLGGNLTNLGTLSPGNSPGTVFVGGNYIGGGSVLTEVQFNNAGTPVNGMTHDFLNIVGNASGTTLLNVVPFAPSNAPAATTGNGIELVRVGGTTGAGTFQLAAPIIFGAYEYTLNYLPNYSGALDGYFLQSRASESLYGEAAMLAAGQAMMAGCLTGEDALVGDGNAHRGRAWAKAGRGNRDSGADTGLDASHDYSCGAGGVDIHADEQLRLGLSGGYGMDDSNVRTPAGVGRLEGDGGLVQLYAEFHSGDFFANVTGGWGAFDWTFDGPNTAVVAARLDGTVGALQIGHSWPIDWWRLGAIGEVAYNDMDCGSDCFLAGTVTDANNWFFKGTLRADATLSNGELRPYLALSLANGDTNTVSNGAVALTTDTNALQVVAKGGASLMVDTQTALFVNGGVTEGLDNDIEGWDVGAGIKAMW